MSDRSGQRSANARRWQLAPLLRSWIVAQPWTRNYGQARGALKTVRECPIATRDRSRLGTVPRNNRVLRLKPRMMAQKFRRRGRRHDQPRLTESLERAFKKTIESTRGPAATSRRSE